MTSGAFLAVGSILQQRCRSGFRTNPKAMGFTNVIPLYAGMFMSILLFLLGLVTLASSGSCIDAPGSPAWREPT
jgi:hypothetical protein